MRDPGPELSVFIETSLGHDEQLKPKFVVDFGKLTARVTDELLGDAQSRDYLPRVPRECQTDSLGRSELRLHKAKVGRAISEGMNVTLANPVTRCLPG